MRGCWLRSAPTAWTAPVSRDDLCSCHTGGSGEIPRSPHPGSREGVRQGVILTAQEAGLVEAVAFTLHLLSEVHGLLAHPTLLPSSPVWHPAGESTVRNRGRALQGWDGAAGAGSGAPAAFPHPTCREHPPCLQGAQTAGLAMSRMAELREPAPSSASCLPGTTGPVCQEQQKSLSWSRGTSQLLSVPGKGRKQDNAGRRRSRSYPGTSSGYSPAVTPYQGDCD